MERDNFNPLPFKITLPETDHSTYVAPMGASDDIFVDEAGNLLKKDLYKQGDPNAQPLLNIPTSDILRQIGERRSFGTLVQQYGLNMAMVDSEGYAYRIFEEGMEKPAVTATPIRKPTTQVVTDGIATHVIGEEDDGKSTQLREVPQSNFRKDWKVLIDTAQYNAKLANRRNPHRYDVDGNDTLDRYALLESSLFLPPTYDQHFMQKLYDVKGMALQAKSE